MPIAEQDLKAILDRTTLFAFLYDKLGWRVDTDDTFMYAGPPLPSSMHGRPEINQFVPWTGNDPFAVFLVESSDEFNRGDLRLILRLIRAEIAGRGRYGNRNIDDLIFICASEHYKSLRFAHFEQRAGYAPRLEVFGWDKDRLYETRTVRVVNLKALEMLGDDGNNEYDFVNWRQSWLKAWDVRKVTREFFEEYKATYNRIKSTITGVPGNTHEKERVFAQRLLNRLLFIQFLSKKGWLRIERRSDYISALWESRDLDSNFYNARLRLLFFAGLNNPQCRDLRRDNPVLFNLLGEMPFLNGGLFEEAPEDAVGSDGQGALVPNEAIRAVIELFEGYNFTITESTPDDIEVAVDPEMLGEVFERLVTEQERKESGSYYTPRSIVQFMCREALKGYLGDGGALVDLRNVDDVQRPRAAELLQKLLRVKVVDPACGSGAYLLGMLHELFDLIGLLEMRADPLTEDDKYRRKLNIIQNNLYGVDLTDFAVETARLRLWLSLVVEDQRKPLDEDCDVALPNLDYKVEQGDSLTAPAPDQTDNLLRYADVLTFNRLKREYLTAHGSDKQARHDELERLRDELKRGSHSGRKVEGFDWAVEFGEIFTPEEPVGDIGGALNLGGTLVEPPTAGGFDIVLANPPYGATVGDNVRDLYFDRRLEGSQSKDTYGLFIARAIQLLRPGGHFSYIVSDTWRTIKSHKPLRYRLANRTMVRHVLDLPSWVFDSPTVNTCVLTCAFTPPPAEHKLIAGDLRNITNGDWQTLQSNLRSTASHGLDVQTTQYARYTYLQRLTATYENYSFFIGKPNLYSLMSDTRFQRLSSVAEVKVGLQTGDNEYYIRKRTGVRGSYAILDENLLVSNEEIANFSEEEKRNGVDPLSHGGRHFIPYDKGGESNAVGGWLPNYHVPTQYFIDWSQRSVLRMRTYSEDENTHRGEAVFRNESYYFTPGVTFSDTGFYAPTFRFGCGSVFDVMGMTIFPNELPSAVIIATLTTTVCRYLIKSFINHTVHTQVDGLKAIPIPANDSELFTRLEGLVNTIVSKQKLDPRYAFHMFEQRDVESIVSRLYGLGEDDIREIELWYCRRYPILANAQGVLSTVQQKYAEYLVHAENVMAKPPGYWKSHPLLTEIAQGEVDVLELKEVLDVDLNTGARSPQAVHSVLRAIASFANSNDGTVVIGVANYLEIKGISRDLAYVNRNNLDGFHDKLRNLVADRLGPPMIGKLDISFERLVEGEVCRIRVSVVPKRDIVYLDNEVFIRDGNGARKLVGAALAHWVQERMRE